jgi:hypothetical protein
MNRSTKLTLLVVLAIIGWIVIAMLWLLPKKASAIGLPDTPGSAYNQARNLELIWTPDSIVFTRGQIETMHLYGGVTDTAVVTNTVIGSGTDPNGNLYWSNPASVDFSVLADPSEPTTAYLEVQSPVEVVSVRHIDANGNEWQLPTVLSSVSIQVDADTTIELPRCLVIELGRIEAGQSSEAHIELRYP